MKKHISTRITALVLGSVMLLSIPAFAYAADVSGTDTGAVGTVATEGYELTIEDNVVTGYTGTPVNVVVPKGVTSIGQNAFSGCDSLESIELPDSLTTIEEFAFRSCKSLESINIPEGVTSIEAHTFWGCENLESIEIPDGVTMIEEGGFGGSGIVSIELPDSLTTIGMYAFRNCKNLESIELPEGVTTIEAYAFQDCKNLASIELPDSLATIGIWAFCNCSSLTSIELPERATIRFNAFENCVNLTDIEIPDSVIDIENEVFIGTPWLREQIENATNEYVLYNDILLMLAEDAALSGEVVLPEGIRVIAGAVFYECENIEKVVLPDGLISIGSRTFSNCLGLKNIEIPTSVTDIGEWAFAGCENLESVKIPYGVTNIRENTFGNCYSLQSVRLPSSVTSIDNTAFDGIKENVVFYVVENSYAHEFAVNNGFAVEFITEEIDEGNDEEENTVSLTAKDTTITVTAPSNILAGDSVFTAKEITNDKLTADIAKLLESKSIAYKNIAEYEFTLKDKNGVEIHEFSDYITISFDLPKQMSGSSKMQVYRLEDDGKTLTACETTVSGTRVSFKTNHLSTYVLVELANAESITQMGDNALLFTILLAGGLALLAIGFKRRNYVR